MGTRTKRFRELRSLIREEVRQPVSRVLPAAPKRRKREMSTLATRLNRSVTLAELADTTRSAKARDRIAVGIAQAWVQRTLNKRRERLKTGKMRVSSWFVELADEKMKERADKLRHWAQDERERSDVREALEHAANRYLGRIMTRRMATFPLGFREGGKVPEPATLIALACDDALRGKRIDRSRIAEALCREILREDVNARALFKRVDNWKRRGRPRR